MQEENQFIGTEDHESSGVNPLKGGGSSTLLWSLFNQVTTLPCFVIFLKLYMSKRRQLQELFTGVFRMTIPNWTIKLQSHTASQDMNTSHVLV